MVEVLDKKPFVGIEWGIDGKQFQYNKNGIDIFVGMFQDGIEGEDRTKLFICRVPFETTRIEGRDNLLFEMVLDPIDDYDTKESNDRITKAVLELEESFFGYWSMN